MTHHPITLPANAVLTVVSGEINRDRIIEVVWEGKVVTMFAIDVRYRGRVIRAAGAR